MSDKTEDPKPVQIVNASPPKDTLKPVITPMASMGEPIMQHLDFSIPKDFIKIDE